MSKRAATDMPGRPMSVSPSEHTVRYDAELKGRNTWRYHVGERDDLVQIEALVTIGAAPSVWVVANVQRANRDTRDDRWPLLARIDETSWRVCTGLSDLPPQSALVLVNAPASF